MGLITIKEFQSDHHDCDHDCHNNQDHVDHQKHHLEKLHQECTVVLKLQFGRLSDILVMNMEKKIQRVKFKSGMIHEL